MPLNNIRGQLPDPWAAKERVKEALPKPPEKHDSILPGAYAAADRIGKGQNWVQRAVAANAPDSRTEGAYDEVKSTYTGPGRRGEFYDQNQDQFRPGMGQATQYWGQVQGRHAQGSGAPQDMSSYYDNAFRQASENINQSMAGQGLLNSSQTADLTSEMATNLAAERALREADYGLRRSADERDWMGQGGRLAQFADQSDLDRLTKGGALAGRYDEMDMSGADRLLRGADLADERKRTREQDYLDAYWRPAELGAGIASRMWGDAGATYQDLLDSEAAGWTGALQQRLAGEQDKRAQRTGELGALGGIISAFYPAAGAAVGAAGSAEGEGG